MSDDERYARTYLAAIRCDASGALRKAEGVARITKLLRTIPAWPTEAEFTLEMARDSLERALAEVNGALGEFEAKPVDPDWQTIDLRQLVPAE